MKLDLSSLSSIREFTHDILVTYPQLDFLVNNAGLMSSKYTETEDGFEMTMAVNHLGPFLLTELLLPVLRNTSPSRIIIVSSLAHSVYKIDNSNLFLSEKNYHWIRAYCLSKRANVIYAKELSRRLDGSGVTVVSLHPGTVKTELGRDINKFHEVSSSDILSKH